jgi:predicted dehydrogenase
VIDQVRATLGEFEAVSALLQTIAPRPSMTADDTFLVQFRLAGGCTGVMHSSCSTRGNLINLTKITGTAGSAWLQLCEDGIGEEVWIDTGSGSHRVPDPADLPRVPLEPPPAEMLPASAKTTKWHSNGSDLMPYTRLYESVAARITDGPAAGDPGLATFADGVVLQSVLDAARRSAAEGGWVSPEPATA